jgi:hypothetical protein
LRISVSTSSAKRIMVGSTRHVFSAISTNSDASCSLFGRFSALVHRRRPPPTTQ